jgi:hypothetical protein
MKSILVPHPCTILQVSLEKGYNVILKDNFEHGIIRGQDQIYKGLVVFIMVYIVLIRLGIYI